MNFDATVYARRNVAAAVRENRLKQLRSVATHYKKQAANYQAVLVVAAWTISAGLGYHQSPTELTISLRSGLYSRRTFYLTNSSLLTLSPPRGTWKRSLVGRSDSIRSMGFGKDYEFNSGGSGRPGSKKIISSQK